MGAIISQQYAELVEVLLFAKAANTRSNWCVVVSSSSGSGWQLPAMVSDCNKDKKCAVDLSRSLQLVFFQVLSSNFNLLETTTFMTINNISEALKEEIIAATNGNPLLLNCFKNAAILGTGRGYKHLEDIHRDIILNLIKSLRIDVFRYEMEGCHKWLSFAAQEYPIPIQQMCEYEQSYLACENLTYYSTKDEDNFVLGMIFPNLYRHFMRECKVMYAGNNEKILQSPVVQGLIFEEKFLCAVKELSMTVKSADSKENLTFLVVPATFQLATALNKISMNCLHYLRVGHRAIDAVCHAEETNGQEYLLLIQVSLSTYEEHRSKAVDIRSKVVSLEKDVSSRSPNPDPNSDAHPTIAEFYRKMADVSEDHVIFLYASPTELDEPKAQFDADLINRKTRIGTSAPPYKYGFINKDSAAAELMKRLEAEIKQH